MIALTAGEITYLTFGLNRFVGFIDGLKEGAQVTLEGSALPYPGSDTVKVLRVQKMTLNGKEYDLAPLGGNPFWDSPPRQKKNNR